ncbi:MAG: SWIM zinc finger domain-containing protein [Cytophagaceae bacterium]
MAVSEFDNMLEEILDHVSPTILSRGKKLFLEGGLESVKESEEQTLYIIHVPGNQEPFYEVQIDLWDETPEATCNCIFFEENSCCKHIVAAVYFLKNQFNPPKSKAIKEAKGRKSSEIYKIPIPEKGKDLEWLRIHVDYFSQYLNIEHIEMKGSSESGFCTIIKTFKESRMHF